MTRPCHDRLGAAARCPGPRMTSAALAPTREIEVLDGQGLHRRIHIPAERPLTVYVDRRELVTLMTLGVAPELLVLGYLRNTQNYVHLAAHGLTLFDVAPARVARDLEQWQGICSWLDSCERIHSTDAASLPISSLRLR